VQDCLVTEILLSVVGWAVSS